MAFNIALSGLNAAQTDLDVKGNNIANASTTGFKRSRAEFGDLYSSGLMNLGSTDTGEGVKVQNTRQLFQQGNITGTSNGLDMAIDGEGFFVVNNGGEQQFTRAGQFGVDQNGFVTNNQGARVQGFQATDNGTVGDVRGDLQVNTENLAPTRTTGVEANLNLDAREGVLEERFSTFTSNGSEVGTVATGSGQDLPAETWEITLPNGNTTTLNTDSGPASNIASSLSQQDGLRVDATTESTIQDGDFNPATGDQLNINGVNYDLDAGDSLEDLAQDISANSPQGVTVQYDGGAGEMTLVQEQGDNLAFDLSGGNGTTIDVAGVNGGAQELNNSQPLTARGVLNFSIDDGYDVAATGTPTDIVSGSETQTSVTRNEFEPGDPNTYNHSTSSTIYDSLGNSHEMTQYFVKEPASGPNPENRWSTYIQVDGEDVGSPDPVTGEPTQARYDLRFNDDGSLNENLSDEVLIDNWVPKDENGDPNGAAGPNPGGETPIPDPPQSSNFAIDYGNTTQVGAEFAINDLQQNGFATGRLTGLDVTDSGVIQARFSNGESESVGQVALANFRNNEGLASVGDTSWVETFESGDAVISRPNTGPLGAIQSSSVEESNVDLSEQLVGLITAQRNFQANSKTIETSDQITQTIINLR